MSNSSTKLKTSLFSLTDLIKVVVDTLQSWSDNRIILRTDDIIIEEIEIIDEEGHLI